MIEENKYIEVGFRVNHLIELIELESKKDIQNRDRWWVLKYRNLVRTLECICGRRFSYLQEEINNTEQMLKLV